MLSRLFIKNFILIDELVLEFDKGLNIITGETGAGKSIMINAIDIALGAKASKELIKTGESKALIELTITNTKGRLEHFYEEYGIDNLGDELVITKEITMSGSRTRINGSMVNQEAVRILREIFVDIHSQHEMYTFMKPGCHITLLDNYAKATLQPHLDEYSLVWQNYLSLKRRLENVKNSNIHTESQIDFLKFQIKEIEEADIKSDNEDSELMQEINVLENAEKLKELSGAISWAISNDDESILEGLSKVRKNLSAIIALEPSLSETETELINVMESVKNIASVLRDYSQSLDNDTERLNYLQERLFLLDKLKRKYGGSLSSVFDTLFAAQKELASVETNEADELQLEKDLEMTVEKLTNIATVITEQRKTYAEVLSCMISEKLTALELPKARFLIDIKPAPLNPSGADEVEFLISTNISEPPKPLVKVASGGELSRVMLALKVIFAQSDDIDTVIFDEIDTGISGKAAQSVADEVKELAKYRQILMITHQAIIASRSDCHFYVSKSQDNSTKISVKVLSAEEKINAVAELAGGVLSDVSIEFAKTLIN